MPFDGAGNYSLPLDFTQIDSAGIPILASDFDTQFEDVEVALNKMLTRDGQGAPSADLPMGTYRHVNVGKASALTQYARADQVQNAAFNVVNSASITGNAALGGTTNPAFAVYTKGQYFLMELSAGIVPSSASATLNINGVSALPIKYPNGASLNGQDLTAGVYLFVYNAGANRFDILSAPRSSDAQYGAVRIATTAEISAGSASSDVIPNVNQLDIGEGEFSARLSGVGTVTSCRMSYKLFNGMCNLRGKPGGTFFATATNATLRVSGLPNHVCPLSGGTPFSICYGIVNGDRTETGAVQIGSNLMDVYVYKASGNGLELVAGAFSAGGFKGIDGNWSVTYPLR